MSAGSQLGKVERMWCVAKYGILYSEFVLCIRALRGTVFLNPHPPAPAELQR